MSWWGKMDICSPFVMKVGFFFLSTKKSVKTVGSPAFTYSPTLTCIHTCIYILGREYPLGSLSNSGGATLALIHIPYIRGTWPACWTVTHMSRSLCFSCIFICLFFFSSWINAAHEFPNGKESRSCAQTRRINSSIFLFSDDCIERISYYTGDP